MFKHTRPAAQITDFYDQGWDKVFVRSETFEKVSLGNHNAIATHGDTIISSKLGLLHYQETGSLRQFERATNAIKGYGYSTLKENPQEQLLQCLQFRSGAGGHHCMYMIRFLLRILVINIWIMKYGSMPPFHHVKWVDSLINEIPPHVDLQELSSLNKDEIPQKVWDMAFKNVKELLQVIDKYVHSLSPDEQGLEHTNDNKISLIFREWDFQQPTCSITQVADVLMKLSCDNMTTI